MQLLQFQPMPLGHVREPFSHPEWFFEIKWDGFRSLAFIERGVARLISRNGNTFHSFATLCDALPRELGVRSAVLDGEIVCLDQCGKAQFRNLLFRRGEPRFYAFDLLWLEDEDLRLLPLAERKHRLRSVIPERGERVLYCDHVEGDGEGLFRLACENDLEGIVAKWRYAPYLPEKQTSWLKIRNPNYSQWAGREEFFERERHREPVAGWHSCELACAAVAGK